MEKPKFAMMIGIPGSGKSTISEEMMSERNDIIYISSDAIREEMYGSEEIQGNNAKIFEEMHNRTKEALSNNLHVIYDATNISRKKRMHTLRQIPKDIEKVAVYVSTEYKDIVKQNSERERVVPIEVINRMYKNLQVPIKSEGWDKIQIIHHDNVVNNQLIEQITYHIREEVRINSEGYDLIEFLSAHFKEFFDVYDMPQDSTYHSFSVSRHIYYVYKYVLDNYETEDKREKEVMLWAALTHDLGKKFCKSFYNYKGELKRYANFIGHENVGAQIAINFLNKMNFDDDFILEVATLVQFHMYLLNENASRQKLINLVGEDTYQKLEFLREADTKAH